MNHPWTGPISFIPTVIHHTHFYIHTSNCHSTTSPHPTNHHILIFSTCQTHTLPTIFSSSSSPTLSSLRSLGFITSSPRHQNQQNHFPSFMFFFFFFYPFCVLFCGGSWIHGLLGSARNPDSRCGCGYCGSCGWGCIFLFHQKTRKDETKVHLIYANITFEDILLKGGILSWRLVISWRVRLVWWKEVWPRKWTWALFLI